MKWQSERKELVVQQIYTEKYRELMESAIPSARGLYPPEILMLGHGANKRRK